jgi:hypothetical protein
MKCLRSKKRRNTPDITTLILGKFHLIYALASINLRCIIAMKNSATISVVSQQWNLAPIQTKSKRKNMRKRTVFILADIFLFLLLRKQHIATRTNPHTPKSISRMLELRAGPWNHAVLTVSEHPLSLLSSGEHICCSLPGLGLAGSTIREAIVPLYFAPQF